MLSRHPKLFGAPPNSAFLLPMTRKSCHCSTWIRSALFQVRLASFILGKTSYKAVCLTSAVHFHSELIFRCEVVIEKEEGVGTGKPSNNASSIIHIHFQAQEHVSFNWPFSFIASTFMDLVWAFLLVNHMLEYSEF